MVGRVADAHHRDRHQRPLPVVARQPRHRAQRCPRRAVRINITIYVRINTMIYRDTLALLPLVKSFITIGKRNQGRRTASSGHTDDIPTLYDSAICNDAIAAAAALSRRRCRRGEAPALRGESAGVPTDIIYMYIYIYSCIYIYSYT